MWYYCRKFVSLFLVSITLLLTSNALAAGKSESAINASNRDYNQKNIKLNLKFNFDKAEVIGEADLTFTPLKNNFEKLILDAKTMKISSVELNGNQLKFSQDDQNLFITLDKPYKKGVDLTVKIKYTAFPTNGLFFFHPTKRNPEIPYNIWSQGEGTNNRYWYPAYDLPDDKLTSEVIATVPENLIAISNGILKSVKTNLSEKTKTFDWKTDVEHSNYLTSIIVGNYKTIKEKVRGTELDYNVPPDWASKVDYFYGRTPQMIQFYSNYIIPYPYKRYAQTTVQDFEYGGMENITATTLNRRLLHGKSAIPNYNADGLIAHELAHQWFGDLLTCKTFKHIWLNEGFATYMTDLWTEHEYGEDEFRYLRYNENQTYFNRELKYQPLAKIKKDSSDVIPAELGGSKAYERGAAVLNMLRFKMGDEAFEKGIKFYVNKYKFKNVVTEQFRKAMEKSSGQNLNKFFNEWVYGAGFPVFDVSYKYDGNSKKLILNVEQAQKQLPAVGIFDVPVLVEIDAGKVLIQQMIEVNKKKQSYSFDCPQKPNMIRFNKYLWDLCKVNFKKSFDELKYQASYDDDIAGRIVAIKQLAAYGNKAIPVLSSIIIRDGFYGVKIAAVNALKKIGGAEVYDDLIIAAGDRDGRVRAAAVKTLSMYSSSKVEHFLIDKINNETNDYVRAAACYAIGAGKMDNAFNILKDALKYDSHRNIVRREVFNGLTILGNPDALPLVKKYTQYKYSYGGMHLLDIAALKCAKSFAKINRDEAINVIASALKNPYFRTRNYAARLLVQLKAVNKIEAIKNVLKNERREIVTNPLEGALKKLEKEK